MADVDFLLQLSSLGLSCKEVPVRSPPCSCARMRMSIIVYAPVHASQNMMAKNPFKTMLKKNDEELDQALKNEFDQNQSKPHFGTREV